MKCVMRRGEKLAPTSCFVHFTAIARQRHSAEPGHAKHKQMQDTHTHNMKTLIKEKMIVSPLLYPPPLPESFMVSPASSSTGHELGDHDDDEMEIEIRTQVSVKGGQFHQ